MLYVCPCCVAWFEWICPGGIATMVLAEFSAHAIAWPMRENAWDAACTDLRRGNAASIILASSEWHFWLLQTQAGLPQLLR